MKRLFMFLAPLLLFPMVSQAALGVQFAGHVLFTTPCTCTGGLLVTYDRLITFGSFPTSGVSLYYQAGVSKLFASFAIGLPGTWELGSFVPGPSACLVGIPPACIPAQVTPGIGYMSYVGTNLLPGFR